MQKLVYFFDCFDKVCLVYLYHYLATRRLRSYARNVLVAKCNSKVEVVCFYINLIMLFVAIVFNINNRLAVSIYIDG